MRSNSFEMCNAQKMVCILPDAIYGWNFEMFPFALTVELLKRVGLCV